MKSIERFFRDLDAAKTPGTGYGFALQILATSFSHLINLVAN